MTETKKQLFQDMIDAIAAYKDHCGKANKGLHTDNEYYANAQAAGRAYADYSGITYERAVQIAMELF